MYLKKIIQNTQKSFFCKNLFINTIFFENINILEKDINNMCNFIKSSFSEFEYEAILCKNIFFVKDYTTYLTTDYASYPLLFFKYLSYTICLFRTYK